MELVPVQSSQIAAVGFDGETKMQVLFRRGGLYEYSNVSIHEYNQVLTASSVGSAFAQTIKGAKPYRKLEHEQKPDPPSPAAPAQPVPEPLPAAASSDPKVQQVSASSLALAERAKTIAVTSIETQQQAGELLLAIAAMRREIEITFKPMKDAAFKTHRTICDQERGLDAPLLQAERTLKTAIGGYVAEQERIAREAEEAQRRQAREEAERVAAEESQRLAIEDAVALEAEGRTEDAEIVLNNPIPVAPVVVAPAPVAPQVARVKGISTREVAKFRIVDEGQLPREYMTPNESAIRAVVARTNGKIRIPGVEVYFDHQVAASRRA